MNDIAITLPTANPWVRGETVIVSAEKALEAAQAVVDLCEDLRVKEFKVAWAYDKPVDAVLNPYLPDGWQASYAMLAAVVKVLREMTKGTDFTDWYNGVQAAYRTLRCRLAYATPGFVQARQASAMRNN
jgi:hypothetical protein